ncbi:MAG: hypothetical protein QNJ62_05155 [Methyloceanibacter sp.]|nr:hypothetical protein [Methyloceanibacter sp.]
MSEDVTDKRIPIREQMKEIARELAAKDTSDTDELGEGENAAPEKGGGGSDVDQQESASETEVSKSDAAPDEEAASAEGESVPPEDADEIESIEIPDFWADEARLEKFKALPEDVQDALLAREKEIAEREQAFAQQPADLQQRYDAINAAFEPHRQRLQTAGLNDVQAIERLLNAHAYLERSPQEALQVLARQYGVNLQGASAQPQATEYADPLEQKVALLEQRLVQQAQAFQQRQTEAEVERRSAVIKAFLDQDVGGKTREDFVKPVADQFGTLLTDLSQSRDLSEALSMAYSLTVGETPQPKAKPDKAVLERAKRAKAANIKDSSEPTSAPPAKVGETLKDTVRIVAKEQGLIQ